MLVYLPSVTNQNPQQVAAAATALANVLSSVVPGGAIDVSFFRRAVDAIEFASANRARVAFVLCDAPFLLDLAGDSDLVPLFRFASGGSERERKMVVVRAKGPKRLADLKGKVLAAVPVPSRSFGAYLGRLFDDVVTASWFSRIEPTQDEFAATAGVLYGSADAALVSDQNPLAAGKLGTELTALYTSSPLSLPVLAARRALVPERSEDALAKRMADLPSRPEGKSLLGGLRIDELRPIADAGERAALLRPAPRRARTLEIAVPELASVPVPADAPLPAAKDLPFVVAVPIPEVPLVR
jgi:hypothetical protein